MGTVVPLAGFEFSKFKFDVRKRIESKKREHTFGSWEVT